MNSLILARLYSLLASAWRQRYTIMLPMFILPVIGVVVSVVSTPKYKSHMSFLVQESGKDNPYLEDLSVKTNVVDRMEGLKTLLHSRHILKSVVEELKGDGLSPMKMEQQIALLSQAIDVRLFGSNLINISLYSTTPEKMAETLSVVSKHFINNLLAPTQSSISSSEQFLKAEITELAQSLALSEEKLATYKQNHVEALPELYAANMNRLRANESLLEQKKLELAGAEQVLSNLQSKVLALDPVMASLEKQLVEFKGELALLRARYTDKHSSVQAVLRKIKRLDIERQALLEGTEVSLEDIERFWVVKTPAQGEGGKGNLLVSQLDALQQEQQKIQRLNEEIGQLENGITQLKSKVEAYGRNEKALKELKRDINVKSKVYEDLLERFEKSRVSRALGDFEAKDRIKVIDKPFNPIKPLNLTWSVYLLLGLVGGLLIGIGFAVFKEILNNRLYDLNSIERLTGVPVLTRLPRFEQPAN